MLAQIEDPVRLFARVASPSLRKLELKCTVGGPIPAEAWAALAAGCPALEATAFELFAYDALQQFKYAFLLFLL